MIIFGYGLGDFGRISGFDNFVGSVAAVLIRLPVLQIAATSRRLPKEEPARNDE